MAGPDAVDMRVLGVTTTPHDYNRAIGLGLGDAREELLSLHLQGVDLAWPSHVDVVDNTEFADQWQVSLRVDLHVPQLVSLLSNSKAVGNKGNHYIMIIYPDHGAATCQLHAGLICRRDVTAKRQRHLLSPSTR